MIQKLDNVKVQQQNLEGIPEKKPWNMFDRGAVIAPIVSDKELSVLIVRSVRAIQFLRCKLNKKVGK